MNNQPERIGVVIPAYNEADNLKAVLDAVYAINWIEEIIVVDDGSTDSTFEVIEPYVGPNKRVLALRLPENQGKAGAMLAGVRTLDTELVIFLDADLIGVNEGHLQRLCQPVQQRLSKMSLAIFRHGGLITDASHYLAPSLSGQRCLWREDAEKALKPLKETRYGVETGLTLYAKRNHWHIQKMIWQGVTHHMKEQKRSLIEGLHSRWQMYEQIAAVYSTSIRIDSRQHAHVPFFPRMGLH